MLRKEEEFPSPYRWLIPNQNYPRLKLTKKYKKKVQKGSLRPHHRFQTLCSIERYQGMEMFRIYKWYSNRCKVSTSRPTTPQELHSEELRSPIQRMALRVLRTPEWWGLRPMVTQPWYLENHLKDMTRWSTLQTHLTYHLLLSRIIELY